MADHVALLSELLPLVDERHQVALGAAIADIGRLDKVERMEADIECGWGPVWTVRAYHAASAATLREAIDAVPEE